MIAGAPLQELPLFAARPAPGQDRIAKLLSILSDGRWHTSRELAVHGFDQRELRSLSQHADGRILSFPGSPGYKDFELATLDEIEQTKALLNQGREVIRRYLRYKKRFHRGK